MKHIKFEVEGTVYWKFAAQICDYARDQDDRQVEDQVWNKVCNQVWEQVGDQP